MNIGRYASWRPRWFADHELADAVDRLVDLTAAMRAVRHGVGADQRRGAATVSVTAIGPDRCEVRRSWKRFFSRSSTARSRKARSASSIGSLIRYSVT